MNENRLTKKEGDFCRWYAQLRNPREAALKSGYSVMPEYSALRLLSKKHIRERIDEIEKDFKSDENLISAGLKRLALGSIADAVRLILSVGTDSAPDIDSLDLFNVAEIKYTCGKGMEIKFFDRFKAFEKLNELSENVKDSSALSFYEALERSAAKHKEYEADG